VGEHSARAVQRADRIRQEIPIAQVLSDYGYSVRPDGADREQQFSCNLHGTGWDKKPSARVYPESSSWYCFACSLSRDAIATVRANEHIGFWHAVQLLETKYGLPPLPWEDGDDDPGLGQDIELGLLKEASFEAEAKRLRTLLDTVVQERSMVLSVAVSYWEAFDKIVWHVLGAKGQGGGLWPEKTGRKVLSQLRQRLIDEL
jgi:DNA primase